MDIKLIATDMDGTLLNDRKEKPASFIPWVLAHPQLRVVIASGRQYYSLLRDFEEIADRLIFIAENGSFIFYKGKMIVCQPMEPDSVVKTLDQLKAFPEIRSIVCGANSAYMQKTDPETQRQSAMYYDRLNFTEDLYADAAGDRIAKIAMYLPGQAQERGKDWQCACAGLRHTVSGSDWIDISRDDVDKGTAIRAIQQHFGIAPEECMAFGDYMNDYSLLASCGESYAMANAVPAIKALAKHAAPSNEEEGVMQILRKMFP